MGVIGLALVLHRGGDASSFGIPTWVKVGAGLAIGFGTYAGGWRIIRTLGQRIYSIDAPAPAAKHRLQPAGRDSDRPADSRPRT
jgi:phosphate/sulfate permease